MTEVLVQVKNLVTHYGETKILDDVSIDVRHGEILVIIGGSGCGKTTLLKHMCGLLRPTAGEIIYQGRDMADMDEEELALAQRTFGIAFQSSGLFNSMTVGDNVALALREYGGMEKELIDAIVRMKLGMVGLTSARDLMPSELSGGMRKRAGLARAIALDPHLLYFDEPSAGLDPITACGLDALILRLRDLLGITFLIVTHELDSIRLIADRIVMLDRGKVIFTGTLDEVAGSEIERVRQFFERRADEHIQ